MCCAILCGTNGSNVLSNVYFGEPINRDDNILIEEGVPKTNAQPPFLLRWHPKLFAEQAPEMFDYDEDTNRLRLKDGETEPWRKPESNRSKTDTKNTWLYCYDCKVRYCPDSKAGRRVGECMRAWAVGWVSAEAGEWARAARMR